MAIKRLIVASVSLALLARTSSAFAQSELPAEARIPLAPGLSVTPAVYTFRGYDTDADRTSTGNPGVENYFAPQIEGWLERGRLQGNFQSAASYQTGGGAKTWNRFNFAQVNSDGGLFGFRGLASHRNHYAPPTDFVGFELGIRSRRVENTFEGEFRLQPVGHRWSASVTASRLGLRYDADQRFRGSSLQFNLNRDTSIEGATVGWAATPLTTLTAAVNFKSDHFLYVDGSDGHGRTVMFGVETKPLGIVTGSAQWGQLTYTDANGWSLTVPSFEVALAVGRGQSTLIVNGSREIVFSFNAGTGFYLETGVDTYWAAKLGKSLEPFVRYQLRRLQPTDPAAGDAFTGAQRIKAGLAYRLGLIRVGPNVEKYDYRGPGGTAGWRVTAFVVLGSERIVRMDRPLADDW
jgi:hypothetical protein